MDASVGREDQASELGCSKEPRPDPLKDKIDSHAEVIV
jgi:hypothetical protein